MFGEFDVGSNVVVRADDAEFRVVVVGPPKSDRAGQYRGRIIDGERRGSFFDFRPDQCVWSPSGSSAGSCASV